MESFWILIAPPMMSLQHVVSSIYRSLETLAWELEEVVSIQDERSVRHTPGSLDIILSSQAFGATFAKGERSVEIQTGNVPGRIDLAFSQDFLVGTDPVIELKAIFAGVALPAGTLVIGGREFGLEEHLGHFPRSQVSKGSERLTRLGFDWISQLSAIEWEALCRFAPEFRERSLTSTGDSYVVLMWDSPFASRDESVRLLPLAKKVVETTG